MHRVASRQNAAQLSSEEKLKTLTYLLTEDETKHCAAIKCLAVLKSPSPNGDDFLFTGSRDGTLKRYSLADGGATYSATFESHLDWVNSAVLTGGNTLVSGSSDTTIKVWNCFSDGTCIKTLKQHSDYVTCLAASKEQSNIVASAGLGGEVFVWDIEAAIVPISQSSDTNQSNSSDTNHSKSSDTKQSKSSDANQSKSNDTNESQGYVPISAKGHKESVYSLAMNETGNVLVSGGTEKVVRVWDPRSGSKTMKLKGHTDNIRALLLDSTGRYCLSGSSDSMIRLWDLGQQRCVHSYAVHTDSVWALASTPTFSHVYSGGRDQSLYCTDLATRETILLCTNENPILELALHDDDIWVGTTNSSLQKWPSEGNNPGKVFEKGPSFLAGNLSFSRARVSLEGSTPVPVYEEPSYTIQGNPGIVQHEILSNRIQVLTKDTTETVKLWQITNGSVIEDYGKVSFEKKKEELMEMVNFPAWFTVGSLQRLGNLSIHIETPQCFFADMYSADLDITGVPEDHKVILARETLKGLFSPYLTKRKEKIGKQRIEEQSNAEQETEKQSIIEQDTEKPSIETQTPHENGVVSSEKDKSNKTLIPSSTLEIASNAENESKVYPPFKFSAASIITGGSEGGLWRKNIKNLNGSEDEKDFPSWVLDCLLRNNLPSRDSTKCSFSCLPYDSSTVPLLLNSRLSAPCILNIQKIINHLATKIDKQFDSMALRIDSKAPRINSKDVKIEILCNDQVLDTKMSLATVWKFVWKKPEDLVINYRVTRVEVA